MSEQVLDDACVDGNHCIIEVFVIPAMLHRFGKYALLEWVDEDTYQNYYANEKGL